MGWDESLACYSSHTTDGGVFKTNLMAGCKTWGTISNSFNKLLNLPNTFIPTSAGTSLFFFLVEGH